MRRDTAVSGLETLLGECLVLVRGRETGSGFFVAPGWVVTCAHVAGAAVGDEIAITWHGRRHTGTVRAAAGEPRSRVWTAPDLAVVQLADLTDHPCVRLDGTRPPQAGSLTAAGHSSTWDTGEGITPRVAFFTHGGRQELQGVPMVALAGEEVNHGLSGGPVLNPETGGVCSVVKGTRQVNSPMGGLATPVDALRLLDPDVYSTLIRAHDRFHGTDTRWSRLAEAVVKDREAPALPSADTRQILGQLAALPPVTSTGDLTRAFADAAPEHAQLPRHYPLLDLRDAFTELAALEEPEDRQLPYPLALAADLVRRTTGEGRSDEVRDLRDAVVTAAAHVRREAGARERLNAGPVSARREYPSILCRIRPLARDHRLFHAAVWHYRSATDITPAGESAPLPLAGAFAWLKDSLPEHIRVMGGATDPGLIEVLLPVEAMDEAIEEWALWPGRASALGRKQRVVLRALERHDDIDLLAGWKTRWDRLHGRQVTGALWCVCGRDRQRVDALEAFIDTHPERAALVLAGSPRTETAADAYRVAIEAGVPVIVWRRGSPLGERGSVICGFPGDTPCSGNPFLSAVCVALDGSGRDEVPERVRVLRNDALLTQDADHVGGRIAVLWDDPGRRLPDARLRPAEEGQPA
ncbi:trypsin-like peptidase domain-containing protein [Streptomyces polygonati]|uniref:Trypsin-like peptidase domain-containing protein n=1 Tax=Streptomyces polygonati TaxID=1617087 RepID=A0ABV8HU54_9ACTN